MIFNINETLTALVSLFLHATMSETFISDKNEGEISMICDVI